MLFWFGEDFFTCQGFTLTLLTQSSADVMQMFNFNVVECSQMFLKG